MKIIRTLVALILVSGTACGAAPEVKLRYSATFESWCASQTGIEISQKEQQGLAKVFPELQKAWDKNGPQLLRY